MIEFQASRRLPSSEELICFDMLTGDLNFDCTSADEDELVKHSLFRKFQDPCRDEEGREKPWTVGTELRQLKLYDPKVIMYKRLFLLRERKSIINTSENSNQLSK